MVASVSPTERKNAARPSRKIKKIPNYRVPDLFEVTSHAASKAFREAIRIARM
jgi:hypothetical protein